MPYYAESGRSRPPNRLTLGITLVVAEESRVMDLISQESVKNFLWGAPQAKLVTVLSLICVAHTQPS
jgi:hypothetical protein